MTDLNELDRLLEGQPIALPTLAGKPTERRCLHPRRTRFTDARGARICGRCLVELDPVRVKRGKNSRSYGNRAELTVARAYGGTKIGHAGGPVDVRGKDFQTQVKTHRRLPPIEWTKALAAMDAARERCPRLLLRFVGPPGVRPQDFFVFRAGDFLDWFGRDE